MTNLTLPGLIEIFNNIFEGSFSFTSTKPPKQIDTDIILDWGDIVSWCIFTVIILTMFILIIRQYRIIEYLTKHLLVAAFVVWAIGIGVYMVGFYHPAVNGLSVVPRSIIASFKMFVVANELARVEEPLRYSAGYMVAFSLTHLAAAFVSFLFIFKMIGYKLYSESRLLAYRIFKAKGKTVHIFWGVNEQSFAMAKSIHTQFSGDTIIFIDIDKECEDQTKQKATLSMITNVITIDNEEIAKLEDIKAYVDHCYNGPSEWDNKTDIFGELGLNSIGKIVKKSAKVNFYFLSDNEVQNIQGALNLENDATVMAKINCAPSTGDDNDGVVRMFVHARKDVNNEVFDHYSQFETESRRAKIKVIDSAFLSVAQLKSDYEVLPVRCVNPDEYTGCVDQPFTALIAGFGGTGIEAFKFLYEFATFINSDLKKSPFKCYAIDQNMDKIAGLMRRKMPNIGEDELELIDAAVNSEKFWSIISEIIGTLNYAFITLNDDHTSLALAVNLFKSALQHRSEHLPKLKIMLRCYNHNSERHMAEVVEKLNKSVECRNVEMHIFGRTSDIYTYESVLSGGALNKAKRFNHTYQDSKLTADEQWEQDFGNGNIKKLMETKRLKRYHAIAEINRQIGQNFSNALHIRTKLHLMDIKGTDLSEELQTLYGYVEYHKGGVDTYNCDEQTTTILRNMAILEHERWISAHSLIGYQYGESKDIVKKLHPDMQPWDKLSEGTRSYDCKVVDTTIKIAYAEAKEKSEK